MAAAARVAYCVVAHPANIKQTKLAKPIRRNLIEYNTTSAPRHKGKSIANRCDAVKRAMQDSIRDMLAQTKAARSYEARLR